MIPALAWRLRHSDTIIGPARRTRHLFKSARYMPAESVWEWQDAGGEWNAYITVGEWRAHLEQLRKAYAPGIEIPEDGARTEDLSIPYTYNDMHRELSRDRIVQRKRLGGYMSWEKNFVIMPFYHWQRRHPGWEKAVERKLQKKREVTRKMITSLQG